MFISECSKTSRNGRLDSQTDRVMEQRGTRKVEPGILSTTRPELQDIATSRGPLSSANDYALILQRVSQAPTLQNTFSLPDTIVVLSWNASSV